VIRETGRGGWEGTTPPSPLIPLIPHPVYPSLPQSRGNRGTLGAGREAKTPTASFQEAPVSCPGQKHLRMVRLTLSLGYTAGEGLRPPHSSCCPRSLYIVNLRH